MTITPLPGTAEAHQPPAPPKPLAPDTRDLWAARVRVAILEELTNTGVCTVDMLHRVGEPGNPKHWGGVFRDPTVSTLLRHAGYTRSTRRACHGRPVSVWALKPHQREEAQARLEASRAVLDHLETFAWFGLTSQTTK